MAVDRVDAARVDLKEDDPRRALLLDAERRWWWMNLVSLGQYGAILGGLALAWWAVAHFFKGLFAGRKR